MKEPTSDKKAAEPGKPRLQSPALERLGTLQELTRNLGGGGNDGGFAGMSMT